MTTPLCQTCAHFRPAMGGRRHHDGPCWVPRHDTQKPPKAEADAAWRSRTDWCDRHSPAPQPPAARHWALDLSDMVDRLARMRTTAEAPPSEPEDAYATLDWAIEQARSIAARSPTTGGAP